MVHEGSGAAPPDRLNDSNQSISPPPRAIRDRSAAASPARRSLLSKDGPLPHTELLATIAGALSAAFVFGLVAQRLHLPLIVGYLLAGVAIGPFTPGFVANAELAPQLAEVGIILLMFGVGIHFSLKDLFLVRRIALPGAIFQVATATVLGIALTWAWGWDLGSGIVLGLAVSVASTVVLLRALTLRGELQTKEGTVAVGWLVVEDLIMVLALVLIPALATTLGGTNPNRDPNANVAFELAWTVVKVAGFVALMLIAGTRIIPAILLYVDRTRSRELFILATLAFALGVAFVASELFGVSFALGAFLAGLVVNESELSHRAAEEALPLREAFSVLFFVSVGMLIEPRFLLEEAHMLAGVLSIVMVGKAVAAVVIVRMLGGSAAIALTVAAGLSQVGEFSFILAEMGRTLDLLPEHGHKLILAAALVSITLNPLLFGAIGPLRRWLGDHDEAAQPDPARV
jgi:CPA2 family monovalent cation:H+ antiporter-2